MIKTKIVATLGPASCDQQTLERMIREGVDVVRLNFSHGTLQQHAAAVDCLRRICKQDQAVVAVMGDLCGPKVRIGRIVGGSCRIESGGTLIIQRADLEGGPQRISTNYPAMIDEVKPPARVLIDDGRIRLRVVEARTDELVCQVDIGGRLADHKGINLPDSDISAPSLTAKDLRDLEWAVQADLDFVALSFVRTADDLCALKAALTQRGSAAKVVAKIEKPQAIEHIDQIIAEADAVMVARGDLGVEMDAERVPLLQKDIVRRCQRAGKPTIIATQMLQSMVSSPVPTRAEVSDVANAILDSTDAVMLSAETSVGQFPVPVVAAINRIATETEQFLARTGHGSQQPSGSKVGFTWAVAHGANLLARELSASLVATWTESGYTAGLLSKHRPPQPIVALSPDHRVCRQMALCYGVYPIQMGRPDDQDAMLNQLDRVLLQRGLAKANDLIVIAAGTRLQEPGATNSLLIHLVAQAY